MRRLGRIRSLIVRACLRQPELLAGQVGGRRNNATPGHFSSTSFGQNGGEFSQILKFHPTIMVIT
jgi:hypothetical protein